VLLTGAAIGAAAVANALVFFRTPPLTSTLPGTTAYYPTPDGDIFYKTAGSGKPLLLVHGIGAGCSSFEWRHVFAELAENHTVYALDLLGFGRSDKPPIAYSAQTYIDLLADFARDVMGVGEDGSAADAIATSLSAAYIVTLARHEPALFDRLVLVCPTGIGTLAERPGHTGDAARAALRTPVLGTSLYNAIASRTGIRQYLRRRVYADPAQVTEDLVTHYHTSAHQPGADRVLPSFLSGHLNCDIAPLFAHLEEPVLIVWGDAAAQTPVSEAQRYIDTNSRARLCVIERAGMLPHDEQPQAFLAALAAFFGDAA
jgi:pimeloyl-ACP methyl ester carboxylesterase